MTKSLRNRRLIAMTAELVDNPGRFFSLGRFCEKHGMAKSTASEDLTFINSLLQEVDMGSIQTNPGATGGIIYKPGIRAQESRIVLERLKNELELLHRRLPGDFLYYSDLIFNPQYTSPLGRIFASIFTDKNPDYVLTLETKGIPIAMFTAHYLNCPLLIARRINKVTEGPSVSTNYLTGSGKRIETMFLPKRSLARNSNVLIIDDFMKAGGSAKGLDQLVGEFDSQVVGIGVLVATQQPKEKLVTDYTALLELGPSLTIDIKGDF